MNSDLKTRLFANVLLSPNDQPAVFRLPTRSSVSLAKVLTAAFSVLSVAGLAFLLIAKLKPFF